MNTSAICTLFDGDFHLGCGALINSLCRQNFRGTFWVGFRGELPPWAVSALDVGRWFELRLGPETIVRFVRLETTAHLTNFKPQFLHRVWQELDPDAARLFYFDPDIVVRCGWSFFEDWADCGVALCEDVNSPMSHTHPRRAAWRKALAARGIAPHDVTHAYVNGGFVGMTRETRGFVEAWVKTMEIVGEEIGGLDRSMFSFAADDAVRRHPAYAFNKTDQDALNMAVMTSALPISIMGQEAMDFKPGGWTMSHALGPLKPWRKHFLRAAFSGVRPTSSDRDFWANADGPIRLFPDAELRTRRRALTFAAALGRFYGQA